MSSIDRINVDITSKQNVTSESVKYKDKSFSLILEGAISQKISGVKFSQHAKARLKDRHIELTDQDQILINNAIERAAEKGAQESLLLLNNLALVVSIKNRTIITAIDQKSQSEKIFTNIDSAVIVR